MEDGGFFEVGETEDGGGSDPREPNDPPRRGGNDPREPNDPPSDPPSDPEDVFRGVRCFFEVRLTPEETPGERAGSE